MKKHFSMFILGIMSLSAVAQSDADFVGGTHPVSNIVYGETFTPAKKQSRVTIEEIFAAPENTVLDGPYTSETKMSGYQSSDLGRPGRSTRYYQAFHGCRKSINALRVIGLFNYFDKEAFDWYRCDSRGAMGADNVLTKPVRFEVSFYREDENGDPGELVFRKNYDIIGRYLGVDIGLEGNMMPLHEFKVELGEEVNLECGYMSFAAADMGDSPACWFSVFTADTSLDHGKVEMDGEFIPATSPCVFSFMGDGKMAAQKALRVEEIKSPSRVSFGTHEKVSVKVVNVGEKAIEDARLELYLDGKLLATEDVYAMIPSGGSYTYTFMQRVDVSKVGDHKVEVRNATPGDEDISRRSASVDIHVYGEGEACESKSIYNDPTLFIKNVTVGNLDNSSQNSNYTDYYATKELNVVPGETYELIMDPMGVAATGVWIDWNGNGVFTDPKEFVGYVYKAPLEFSVPSDIAIKAGTKRMRIVMDRSNKPQPCGEYSYGETEDYGVVVSHREGTSVMQLSVAEISESSTVGSSEVKEIPIEFANVGGAELDAKLSVEYILPVVYGPRKSSADRKFEGKFSVAPSYAKTAEPSVGASVQHVLSYDQGFVTGVGVGNYDTAIFGQRYSADVIQTVKGMKLSSVDVYICDVTGKNASVKIFGQGVNGQAGNLLAEKEFTPVADSWNHIELDTPVTLDGTEIWYGIELRGMQAGQYYIGIDQGPAVAGYGEVCRVDNYWWSMSELGIDSNVCVRANLTGERTNAINWLKLDKNAVKLQPNGKENVKASLETAGLEKAVYEAKIKIASNDELCAVSYIPVYLTNGGAAGIVSTDLERTSVKVIDGNIVVNSEEEIAQVAAFDLTGRLAANNTMVNSCKISISDMPAGVYVVRVVYSDGVVESFKVVVIK